MLRRMKRTVVSFLVPFAIAYVIFGQVNGQKLFRSFATSTTKDFAQSDLMRIKDEDDVPSSLVSWQTIENSSAFSLLSMVVQHKVEGNWYIPSLHAKYSVGWNRTMRMSKSDRPIACNVRFFGMVLESAFQGFIDGGTGQMDFTYIQPEDAPRLTKTRHIHDAGLSSNEVEKIYCYYHTNKFYGSETADTPKTLGLIIYCPITLDIELGEFHVQKHMVPGYVCRNLAESSASIKMRLKPSFFGDASHPNTPGLLSTAVSTPAVRRELFFRDLKHREGRPHAVCTVQTFISPASGPLLHAFVSYYLATGWTYVSLLTKSSIYIT